MRIVSGRCGKVSLVGAGPGDPELMTVKGMRLLRAAQVVVYDRLVSTGVLDEAPRDAEKIHVGKRGGHYSFPQEKINRLLVDRAQKGLDVVRLKGGDPFLFGRGGEEVLYLREHGIPCEVVPGVSSALAAPSAAGIPVTQRGVASTLAVVSGHQMKDPENPVDWSGLASGADTLVVMMPLGSLRSIVGHLIVNGRSFTTPAAVIQAATTPEQKIVVSTLREIASQVERAGLTSPALLVVGEVVRMARPEPASFPAVSATSGVAEGTG